MGKNKRKRDNTPRTKRMKKEGRKQSAVHWLPTYNGKSIIKGYSKRYAVDKYTALIELTELGVAIPRKTARSIRAQRKRELQGGGVSKGRRRAVEQEVSWPESDETYAYIAGYTGWGFAYGITWEEMERFADQDSLDETLPAAEEAEYWLYQHTEDDESLFATLPPV